MTTRTRSWNVPADHYVVVGEPSLLATALERAEHALDGFPADSPACIGYATRNEPRTFCGIQDERKGASVRLHGIVDNGHYDTWTDDTLLAMRGVRGDRYAGLIAKASKSDDVAEGRSTLRLCLEAVVTHMRCAIERPAARNVVDLLARRARAVTVLGHGRGHDGNPRLRGTLATPWGAASSIPMLLGSGAEVAAGNLLTRRERVQQDDLTAVLVTVRNEKIDILKDVKKPRDRKILKVKVSPFWADIESPGDIEVMDVMRLLQSLGARPE